MIITNYTDFDNRKWKNRLEGGDADEKEPEDFDPLDIEIGTKVQREHTSNPDIATELSMDHLEKDDEYYDKLITAGLTDNEDAIELYNMKKDKYQKEKVKKELKDIIYNDEEESKNNYKHMEKMITKFENFTNENADESPTAAEPIATGGGVPRGESKENKYRFLMEYSVELISLLKKYNFEHILPETEDKKIILIDTMHNNFQVLNDKPVGNIKMIDMNKLNFILQNL